MRTNTITTHDCPGCGISTDEETLHCARCLHSLRSMVGFGSAEDAAVASRYLALEETLFEPEYVDVPLEELVAVGVG